MTAKLTITLSDEVLAALRASKTINISLAAANGSGGRAGGARTKRGSSGMERPREGSLPARILDWAEKRGKPFRTADAMKRLKINRAHASMVLGKLANGPYPIERAARGVYEYRG